MTVWSGTTHSIDSAMLVWNCSGKERLKRSQYASIQAAAAADASCVNAKNVRGFTDADLFIGKTTPFRVDLYKQHAVKNENYYDEHPLQALRKS